MTPRSGLLSISPTIGQEVRGDRRRSDRCRRGEGSRPIGSGPVTSTASPQSNDMGVELPGGLPPPELAEDGFHFGRPDPAHAPSSWG